MLDDKQSGQLRRILDLAAQLPDDWSGMMGRSSLQEDFGTLRFQLSYMVYTLALAHVHRMPSAPARFKNPMRSLITKLLSPDVWTYWHYISTGNGPFSGSLGNLPARWNPVDTDNIMYSAYIQSTALLYHYLFDDAEFAEPGALSFKLRPLYWGKGGQTFIYDEKTLNDHIFWTMVSKGFLGIACEPNCVFQICNQPAILGFRLHDLIYGGDLSLQATDGYLRAWEEFGQTDPTGHYNVFVREHERKLAPVPPQAWADFWMGALANAWYPEEARKRYDHQKMRWLRPGPDDTLWVEPTILPFELGPELTSATDFGWAAVCASEMGDNETLVRLLKYADRFLNPISDRGAYYYGRRDQWLDEEGRLAAMDPHTGNVLLAYARLNVEGGLRAIYDGAWHSEHFQEPAIVAMPDWLDLRGAKYERDKRTLTIVWKSASTIEVSIPFTIDRVFGRGNWTAFLDGEAAISGNSVDIDLMDLPARRSDKALIFDVPTTASTLQLVWN